MTKIDRRDMQHSGWQKEKGEILGNYGQLDLGDSIGGLVAV
jgi:hypothetical protein